MENRSWWVTHVEFGVMFVTLVGAFFTLNSNIKMETFEIRQELQATNQRTDKLYEIIIDNQKETQSLFREIHARVCVLESKDKS